MLRRANTVWDYSASNVPSLAALGISATHVPLGDAPPWRIRPALAAAVSANASSTLPVLFYGTLTRHRAATLAAIRAGPNGQPVVHANAATDGTFGAALDAQIAAADVVLNLRAFGDRDDEWKMPRLAKLFANRKFVISEGTCDPGGQCEAYAGGLVFAERRDLKAAVAYYRDRPAERAAIADRGHALFATRSMATVLRGPVQALLDGRRGVS